MKSTKDHIFTCKNKVFLVNFMASYVTSFYFVVTTATTVGYGDHYARTAREKNFCVFL